MHSTHTAVVTASKGLNAAMANRKLLMPSTNTATICRARSWRRRISNSLCIFTASCSTRLSSNAPDLVQWIRQEGGFVHEGLRLDDAGPLGTGLASSHTLLPGTRIISLPRHVPLALPPLDSPSDHPDATLLRLARHLPAICLERIMSWLSRHQKVRFILWGMAENCICFMRCRNVPELQVRQKHCFLGLQTLKPNSYRQAMEFTMGTPIYNSWSSGRHPYTLGSIQKIKEYLYGSSQYETLLIRAQPWNHCLICEFSTQKFERSVPQFRQSTRGPTFQKLAVHQARGDKSQATLLYLVALVVAMVGSTYAAVPLYRKFCQATGYGGTIQRRETVEEKIARHAQEGTDTSRELVVQFNADVADGMPWKFIPSQREVRVKPGESALAFYTAENLSSKPITGVSTYNVTPMKVAIYFNKIQCFCFEEQRLLPGEKIDMPVFFYVDPEFATDPKMDGINNMILSYTFFKVEDEEP